MYKFTRARTKTGLAGQTYSLRRETTGEIGADVWASSIAMVEYLQERYGIHLEGRGSNGGGGSCAEDGDGDGDGDGAGVKGVDVISTAPDEAAAASSSSRAFAPLAGKKALELGAGLGFVSLVLRELGCQVLATDKANMLPLLETNLREAVPKEAPGVAGGNATAAEYNWSVPPPNDVMSQRPFDLVVCADCLYAQASVEPLLQTLAAICTRDTQVRRCATVPCLSQLPGCYLLLLSVSRSYSAPRLKGCAVWRLSVSISLPAWPD